MSASFLAAPLENSQRILLLDVIRGIAILGILIMNIPYFGLPIVSYYDLRILNEMEGINSWVWRLMMIFFEGSMRGLFCMLFGAGAILLIRRLDTEKINNLSADIFYRRLLWLILFGIIDEYILLWPGDILFPYAIAGLFLFPFRNSSPGFLIRAFIICILIYTLSIYTKESSEYEIRTKGLSAREMQDKGQVLTDAQKEDLKNWVRFHEEHGLEGKQKAGEYQTHVFRKGYGDIAKMVAEINIEIQSVYLYLFAFWDYLGFMFLGMALYKMKIITGERSTRFYLMVMIISYGVGIVSSYYYTEMFYKNHFDSFLIFENKIFDVYQIHRLGLSMGHLSLIILLFKSGFFRMLFEILAKVGKMAFTNYLLQTLLCTLFFFGHGLGYFGKFERYQLYYVVAGVWLFEILFSIIWMNFFRIGPFEWIWRCLTYKKWLPLKIVKKEIN